jgi:hypothetical protein
MYLLFTSGDAANDAEHAGTCHCQKLPSSSYNMARRAAAPFIASNIKRRTAPLIKQLVGARNSSDFTPLYGELKISCLTAFRFENVLDLLAEMPRLLAPPT